ncbi:MAG: prolyl oligopeptidase family serine peptidase, partial [Silvibacterium sp.]
RRNRQVAIDDFTSAAHWLHDEGLSSPQSLAIFGGSNSGLLVAAALTQHPERYCAALCIAPLADMLRYERFDHASKWRSEYGAIEDPEDFRALYGYSPYHHVNNSACYPSALFVTGGRDERCNPAHAMKMVALLQDLPAQANPVLLDYDKERGHSATMPLSVRIEALTRRIAFLCREICLPFTQLEVL